MLVDIEILIGESPQRGKGNLKKPEKRKKKAVFLRPNPIKIGFGRCMVRISDKNWPKLKFWISILVYFLGSLHEGGVMTSLSISAYRRSKCYIRTSNAIKNLVQLITMFSNFDAPCASATITQLVASLASIFLVYGFYKIFVFVYGKLTSPLRYVPGPPSSSYIYGSFKQLSESVSRKPHCFVVIFEWLCLNEHLQIEQFYIAGGLGQPIRIDNPIQSGTRSELIIIDQYLVTLTSFFSLSRLVLWPPISKQPITYFSIVMTIWNLGRSGVSSVDFLEVVHFAV